MGSDEHPTSPFTMAYGCLEGNYGRVVLVDPLVRVVERVPRAFWLARRRTIRLFSVSLIADFPFRSRVLWCLDHREPRWAGRRMSVGFALMNRPAALSAPCPWIARGWA